MTILRINKTDPFLDDHTLDWEIHLCGILYLDFWKNGRIATSFTWAAAVAPIIEVK